MSVQLALSCRVGFMFGVLSVLSVGFCFLMFCGACCMDLGTSCWPWPLECVLGLCCGSAGPIFPLFCLLCSPSWRFPCFFCFAPWFWFVLSLDLFRPVGSAGVGGRRWWIRGYPEAALPLSMLRKIFFVVLFFLLLKLATGS